jgi:hypothetical protein
MGIYYTNVMHRGLLERVIALWFVASAFTFKATLLCLTLTKKENRARRISQWI